MSKKINFSVTGDQSPEGIVNGTSAILNFMNLTFAENEMTLQIAGFLKSNIESAIRLVAENEEAVKSRNNPAADNLLQRYMWMLINNIRKVEDIPNFGQLNIPKYAQNFKVIMNLVARLVEEAGANPNLTVPPYNYTPLHLAGYLGFAEEWNRLVANGANIRAVESSGQKTPLDFLLLTKSASDAHEIARTFNLPRVEQKKLLEKTRFSAAASVVVRKSAAVDLTVTEEIKISPEEELARQEELREIKKVEDLKSLENKMRLLRQRPSAEILREVMRLMADTESDFTMTIAEDSTLLHIAAGLGDKEVVADLLQKGADINAITRQGGFSVLKSALNGGKENEEVIKLLVSNPHLEMNILKKDLKEEAGKKSSSGNAVGYILNNQSVIDRFRALPASERNGFIGSELRFSLNRSGNKTNGSKIKRFVDDFEKILREPVAEEEVKITISKNERERIRKARNKEKAQQEQDEKVKEKFPLELMAEFWGEFVIEVAAEARQQLELERQQVEDFLRGERKIESIRDMPEFLQPIIGDFLARDAQVFVKGSSAYLGVAKKAPSDLDLEIHIKEMSQWNDEIINDFVAQKIGCGIAPAIYRSATDFTVNVLDEVRGIDLTFYDCDKLPPPHLGWTTSREEKIFFNSDGQAQRMMPRGLEIFLGDRDFNRERDFIINPRSFNLLMRLSFLETIGHISKEEMVLVKAAIHPRKTVDLLCRELKLNLAGEPCEREVLAKKKLSSFMKSHSFDEEQQVRFIENLHELIGDNRVNPQYQILYKVMDEILLPSAEVRVDSGEKLSENIPVHGRS